MAEKIKGFASEIKQSFADKTKSRAILKADKLLLLILTGAYLLIALLNLGTLNFPTTVWTRDAGGTATIDFGEEVQIASYWVNACTVKDGFPKNGSIMTLTADNGEATEFAQKDGEMFKWLENSWSVATRYVRLKVTNPVISLNEIAFKDGEGKVIPILATTDDSGKSCALTDEQGTVPAVSTYFNSMYFDEIYHGRTAYEGMHGMYLYEWTHPPLGKIIISIGIAIFGMVPFGWRFMGAIFGAAMIPLLYIFAKRIFKRTDLAFISAALWACDCMHFTQTRIATIDTFGVFFIVLMFFYMFEWMNMSYYDVPFKTTLKPLALCGLFFGIGSACKWIGLYAGAGLAVLLFITLGVRLYDYSAAKTREEKRRTEGGIGYFFATIAICIPFFVIIPAIIYFASYYPYFVYQGFKGGEFYGTSSAWKSLTEMGKVLKGMWNTVWKNQESMYGYHSGMAQPHSSQSPWFQWPLQWMSTWFYLRETAGGQWISNISTTGNPVIFIGGSFGALALLTTQITGRTKPTKATLLLLIAVAANLVPWMLVKRAVFIYHFFATTPFLILSSVYLLAELEQKDPKYERIKWRVLVTALILFILMSPAISGTPMPRAYAWFLEYCLPAGNIFHGRV